MSTGTTENAGFLRRVDFLILLSALVTLFLALASDPWWTLNGTTTSRLLTVQVSPFYLRIGVTGLPSTLAIANAMGSMTRVLVFLGFIALVAASIKPSSWWRNLAVYFGISILAELYLSFIMMYYWAQTVFNRAYGTLPPFFGTSTLQASILGLDLRYYPNPQVTAAFTLPYYLGFLSMSLILGRSLIRTLHERALRVLSALLPGGEVHDIYLTPPYQHVWFSSGDRQFNPLSTDPGRLNDDELLVSFQRLYETVEPGGSLSVILPAWATSLADRFQRLMPNTGFAVESAGIIYRTAGKPENELRFRKPVQQEEGAPIPLGTVDNVSSTPDDALPSVLREGAVDTASPPVLEVSEEPAWIHTRMTRIQRVILKAAVETIVQRQEPVPYRELVNQVYMELVDRKIEFDSAGQIETILLDHNGREVLLVEEADDADARIVKKWWLGNQKMMNERRRRLPSLRFKLSRPRIFSRRAREPGYRPKPSRDEGDS